MHSLRLHLVSVGRAHGVGGQRLIRPRKKNEDTDVDIYLDSRFVHHSTVHVRIHSFTLILRKGSTNLVCHRWLSVISMLLNFLIIVSRASLRILIHEAYEIMGIQLGDRGVVPER